MNDTIDLLDAIGSDASLRHASSDVLADHLSQVGASEALIQAASHGDRQPLAAAMGPRNNEAPQVVQQAGYEEEEQSTQDIPLDEPSEED